MRTIDFILKEMGRRKRGAVAGIMCVLLGISIFVAAQTTNKALYDKTKEQLLRFGANIIVQPKGEPFDIYSGSVGGAALLPEIYTHEIRRIKHSKMLVAVSPKLYERFKVGDQSLLVVGITPEERKAKPWWLINNEPIVDQTLESKEVLLGHHAARRLGFPSHLKLNGESFIELNVELFRVTGILDETGSPDDFTAFVPLSILQTLTRKQGMVNLFEVSTSCIACKAMNVNEIAKEIDKMLPGDAQALPVKQIAEAQMATLIKVEQFTRIIYLVVLCLGAFLLMNHMSSSVANQRRDIGMFLAMGMESSKIHKIFILKGVILGFIGGLGGYLVGTGISMLLGPQIAETKVTPIGNLLLYSLGIALVVGAISSILPARKAATLDPIEALREV